MKTIKIVRSLFLAATLLFGACNNNRENDTKNDTTSSVGEKINEAVDTAKSKVTEYREEDFVTDVIESNTKEIAWLNAAISRSTDNELKSHAGHMLADHQKMGKEMKAYAAKKNYKADIDTTNSVDINNKSGRDWDKAWADKMVDEHEKLADKFERNQDNVQDQELKTMITKSLPTLRSHLGMAKKLQSKLQ